MGGSRLRLAKTDEETARRYIATSGVGTGEAEALALAARRNVTVIIDDSRARRLAQALGLEFIGSAAVLLEACLIGFLGEEEFLESLKEMGKIMWLSPDVIAEVLRRSKEAERE